MYKGTVKIYHETKGFGYIIEAGSGQEIFVHVTGLIDNIKEGDAVFFDTARGKKGVNAINVQRA